MQYQHEVVTAVVDALYAQDRDRLALIRRLVGDWTPTHEREALGALLDALEGLKLEPQGEDYGQGYADGKAKAYWEIRTRLQDTRHHAPRCNCDPCHIIRAVAEM